MAEALRAVGFLLLILVPVAVLTPAPAGPEGVIQSHLRECPDCEPAHANPVLCGEARRVSAGALRAGR